jgi:hypothetical protein
MQTIPIAPSPRVGIIQKKNEDLIKKIFGFYQHLTIHYKEELIARLVDDYHKFYYIYERGFKEDPVYG